MVLSISRNPIRGIESAFSPEVPFILALNPIRGIESGGQPRPLPLRHQGNPIRGIER